MAASWADSSAFRGSISNKGRIRRRGKTCSTPSAPKERYCMMNPELLATWPSWQLLGAPAYLHLVTPNAFAAGPTCKPQPCHRQCHLLLPSLSHPSSPSPLWHEHCVFRPPAPGCALRTCSHAHLSPNFAIELAFSRHVSGILASRPSASLPRANPICKHYGDEAGHRNLRWEEGHGDEIVLVNCSGREQRAR